jgi:hypothetical protein
MDGSLKYGLRRIEWPDGPTGAADADRTELACRAEPEAKAEVGSLRIGKRPDSMDQVGIL